MQRREFLKAALAAPLVPSPQSSPIKIDIHNHYYPASYFEMIRDLGAPDYRFATDASGATTIEFRGTRFFGIQPPMTDVALRIEEMDRVGVDVQVLSLSVPNVYFAEEGREPEIARKTNDAYAELIARNPRRFKALASVPMDVPDEASKELARALDELKLQGVLLLSHIRGKPLTDPRFRRFFEEANRRKLFILVHPMLPSGMGEQLKDYVLGPLVGFPFDSTLAVARMCFDGLFQDFPDIRFLVPHLGGAIPYLLPRLDQGFHDFPACRAKIENPPSFYLKKLYFDTVSASPSTISFVRDLAGANHIAFGSDYPHLPGSMSGAATAVGSAGIPESDKARIFSGTALA
ncbi:MAG TPA: amidohydrolase family protein, partial [Vicinamibacteria bacterium]